MLSIISGIVGIIIGTLMVWKPNKFLEMIGEPGWTEKIFGYGRGATAYQAIGIIIIIISLMLATGIVQRFLVSIFVTG